MLRLVIGAVIGLVLGAGGAVGVMATSYPSHGRLDCTLIQDSRVTDCTDSSGKHFNVPHDVRIRQ
jgi:hypothetical protein